MPGPERTLASTVAHRVVGLPSCGAGAGGFFLAGAGLALAGAGLAFFCGALLVATFGAAFATLGCVTAAPVGAGVAGAVVLAGAAVETAAAAVGRAAKLTAATEVGAGLEVAADGLLLQPARTRAAAAAPAASMFRADRIVMKVKPPGDF